MAKHELKVGDRVRVFTNRKEFKGWVDLISSSGMLSVIEDGFYSAHNDGPFHPRQCVRLVPKKRPTTARVSFDPIEALMDYYAERPAAQEGVFVTMDSLANAWKESFGAGNVFRDAMPILADALGISPASKKGGGE